MFPRFIREDAFLRDRSRRVLDATLGYKIDEKLAGYDEERLLFSLLSEAAISRLSLFYQRADVEGRFLASSTFLEEARRRYGLSPEREEAVPRQLTELVNRHPSVIRLLPIQEVVLHRILQQQDPTGLLRAMERPPELFQQGHASLRSLEFGSNEVGDHDGLTGPLADHWSGVLDAGFSPSALESYARCPFQYFGRHVLQLKVVRPDHEEGPAPRLIGTLCHAALRLCYERLTAAGWPDSLGNGGALAQIVRTAVHEVFAAHASTMATGYQLLWDLSQDLVENLVQEAILSDREDCLRNGYRPVAFELDVEGRLTACETSELPFIKIRGRLDRVDERQGPSGFRIVDYKYKQGANQPKDDRDLATSALRGFRLQPPLYALMTIPDRSQVSASDAGPSLPDLVEFLFLAPHWTPPIDRSPFDASLWTSAAGPMLQRTMMTLLHGIRDGQFVILPGLYCDHCEFASACRLQHGPTWGRAYHSSQARTMRALRKQKVPE
jgi:ATP-dependent helicase/nuclease subunit B